MIRRALMAAAFVAATALGGCATYSDAELAAQCPMTDWYAYGANDGRLGQPASRAGEFFDGCRAQGVEPDLTAYQAGRNAGLMDYCTAENGYEVGVEGRRYHGVCPPELEVAFRQGLDRGRSDRPSRPYWGWPYFTLGIGIGSHHGHFHHYHGFGTGLVFGY